MSACLATCAPDGLVISHWFDQSSLLSMLLFVGSGVIATDAEATGARFILLISITARPDAYITIALRSDVGVELFFPFKVTFLGAIIFIREDATEEVATTVVTGRVTFDVSFGRGSSDSGGGSSSMAGLSLPGEANSARYSSVTESIVDTILYWI